MITEEYKDYKMIGICNCYDFCEIIPKLTTKRIDIISKLEKIYNQNPLKLPSDYPTIWEYYVQKYQQNDSKNLNQLISLCNVNNNLKYNIVSYADLGCIDSNYNGRNLWQYFGSLGTSIALGMKYKIQFVRFSDKRTAHISKKSSKVFTSHVNTQYRQFWKVRNNFNIVNDPIFQQCMINKFGKENAIKRMNKYSFDMTGAVIDVSRFDPNWTTEDYWKFQIDNTVSAKALTSKL